MNFQDTEQQWMKGHEPVFGHTDGWAMHDAACVNKKTENTVVEPPDVDDFCPKAHPSVSIV